MQDVVQQGADFVFARHQDGQDLTGVYIDITYDLPTGPLLQPAPDIVQTPRDFVYAYDSLNRLMDPRRFAGSGGTPLGP